MILGNRETDYNSFTIYGMARFWLSYRYYNNVTTMPPHAKTTSKNKGHDCCTLQVKQLHIIEILYSKKVHLYLILKHSYKKIILIVRGCKFTKY